MLKMTLLMIQRLFKSVLIKINAPDAGTKQLYHHWRLGPFERFDIYKKIYVRTIQKCSTLSALRSVNASLTPSVTLKASSTSSCLAKKKDASNYSMIEAAHNSMSSTSSLKASALMYLYFIFFLFFNSPYFVFIGVTQQT